jgi:valyl-tRNA synthetase
MPFVTDELWHQIATTTNNQTTKSILLTNYPTADKQYFDDKAETEMDYLIRLIRSIRNIRQTYNVPHTTQIDVIFQAEGNQEALIEQYKQYIEKLTPVKLIAKSAIKELPARCAIDTIDKTTIYIPLSNVIDVEKTKDKLLQRKQSAEKDLQKTKQILDSNEFKIKAPSDKVELVQKQLESAQTQINHLEAQLKVLN